MDNTWLATVDQIKKLAADGYGEFLPSFLAVHRRCVGIRTSSPDSCAAEAQNRNIGPINIYLAGVESVVCWPLLAEILEEIRTMSLIVGEINERP